MGKATVVSFIQRPVVQPVPMCLPAEYTVPGATSLDEPGLLVIEDGQGFKFVGYDIGIGVEDGMITNMIKAIDIARGICLTHINAQIFTDISNNVVPGIFAVDGEYTLEQVKSNFKALYDQHRANQVRYYGKLIAEGDDAWTRFRQHRFIAEPQREAARIMGQKREWAEKVNVVKIDCPGCGEYVHSHVAVCKHCGCIVNAEKYATLQFVSGTPSIQQVSLASPVVASVKQ